MKYLSQISQMYYLHKHYFIHILFAEQERPTQRVFVFEKNLEEIKYSPCAPKYSTLRDLFLSLSYFGIVKCRRASIARGHVYTRGCRIQFSFRLPRRREQATSIFPLVLYTVYLYTQTLCAYVRTRAHVHRRCARAHSRCVCMRGAVMCVRALSTKVSGPTLGNGESIDARCILYPSAPRTSPFSLSLSLSFVFFYSCASPSLCLSVSLSLSLRSRPLVPNFRGFAPLARASHFLLPLLLRCECVRAYARRYYYSRTPESALANFARRSFASSLSSPALLSFIAPNTSVGRLARAFFS